MHSPVSSVQVPESTLKLVHSTWSTCSAPRAREMSGLPAAKLACHACSAPAPYTGDPSVTLKHHTNGIHFWPRLHGGIALILAGQGKSKPRCQACTRN